MILPSKEFLEIFKRTEGALSVCESIAIMNLANEVVGNGLFIELGTHKGKSAMSAMETLPKGIFLLVDPIFKDQDIFNKVSKTLYSQKSKTELQFLSNTSLEVIEKIFEVHTNSNGYSYVFVDSGVHDDLVMEEVKLLENRILPNGIIAFHDYQNQFTAVERAYDYLVSTGKFEPIVIDWKPIFDYVRDNDLENGNVSWHEKGSNEFPKYVGALKRL